MRTGSQVVDILLLSTVIIITIYLLVNNPYVSTVIKSGGDYLNKALNAAEGQ